MFLSNINYVETGHTNSVYACVEKKNQLDTTEWFIALIIFSIFFGHFYAHHQEPRDNMFTITAYGVRCLGCWLLEVRYRATGYASGMRDVARLSNIPHSEHIAGCPAPDLQKPATKASRNMGGNNKLIVANS